MKSNEVGINSEQFIPLEVGWQELYRCSHDKQILNSHSLLDGLSKRFELTEEQKQHLCKQVSESLETQPQLKTPSIIGLSTSVSTFVANKSFHNFAVPKFASHWGVVCQFSAKSRILFHLLFDPNKDKVSFDIMGWKDEWTDKHAVTQIGKSSYDYPTIDEIGKNRHELSMLTHDVGKELTNAFELMGGYHLLFWNCQNFAKIFLQLICHVPPILNFQTWSSADVTRLVSVLQHLADFRHFARF